jgi:O-antigen/teichoic acid export membrane protein
MVTTFMLQGVLAGFEYFRGIAQTNLIQGVVLFIAVIPLTYIFGLTGTVIGMSISLCTAAFICLIKIIQKSHKHGMPLGLHGTWEERRILWHYSTPSLLTGLVIGPTSMFSKALVANSTGGILGIGGFTAAFRWRDIIMFIPGSVRRVTLPMLSKLKGENDFRRFVKALWANIALNGGIALAGAVPIMILSPWILSLYGPDFREDWDIMVMLVGSGVFQAVNDVVTQVTACMEKMWWNFFIHVIWGTIVLGGSYLLVPSYGVRGYVWSFSTATVVHLLLNTIAAMVIIRIPKFSGDKENGLCKKE